VEMRGRGWYIRADRMIERLFMHLVENTLQHGGNVKKVGLRTITSGDELHIIYTDDGKGIAEDQKEAIFQIAHGERAGVGLFLCRSILEVSGMTILENGEPGKGARFEIVVPQGNHQSS